MKRTIGMTLILTLAASWMALAQVGGKTKADARLRRALIAADLKFTEQSNGDFRLHFTLQEDRSQLVFAESKVQTMGVVEVREVWSMGWKGDREPTAYVANKLLRDNSRRKVGAWELVTINGKYHAIFNVKLSADTDGDALKEIVYAIAKIADEMELELLKSDDF